MPDQVLRRMGAAYRLELRLLGHHWSFTVLHLLWAGMMIASFSDTQWQTDTAKVMLGTVVRFIAVSLLSLVALFVAGISAGRSRQSRFDMLEEALPTGLEIPLGRWLAVLTAIGTFLIEPLGIALARGPLASFLVGAPVFLLESVLLLAFTTALTWWLTGWLGMRRWGYPLLAAVWIGFLVAPGVLHNMGVPGSSLLNFTGNGTPTWTYSELFGRLILGRLPLLSDLFYGGLALLFVGLFAWRWHVRRFYRRSPAIGLLLGAALIAVIVGAGSYVATAAADMARYREIQVYYMESGAPGEIMPEDLPEVVDAYDITLNLSNGTPRFTARLDVRNRGEAPISTLTFTLNQDLEITQSSLPLERGGNRLELQLPEPLQPGATLPVQIEYRGSPTRIEDYGGNLRYTSFADPSGVRLPLGAGWYPLVGWTMSATYLTADVPARFHVAVEGVDGLTFASNLAAIGPHEFESAGATWAMLIGSPYLAVETIGQTTLAAARDLMPQAREQFAAFYEPALTYFGRFFPDVPLYPLSFVMLDNPYAGMPGWDYGSAEQWVMVVEPGDMADIRDGRYGYVLSGVVTTIGGSGLWPIADSVGLFLWSHYQTGGDAAAMRAALEDPAGPIGYRVQPDETFMNTLFDLDAQYGDEGIVRALRWAMSNTESLMTASPEQIAAGMQEAARVE